MSEDKKNEKIIFVSPGFDTPEIVHIPIFDIIATRKLKNGDFFLWVSGMTGRREIHQFHSDAGYGVKTWTQFNEKDGSSMIVNWSGVCGKIIAKQNM